jgi:putative transposase
LKPHCTSARQISGTGYTTSKFLRAFAASGDCLYSMGRIARVVVPDCWHHITQRGNRQQMVFYTDADRAMYLELLARHCQRAPVAIAGYCLMGNHIHLIAVPSSETGLAMALGRTHNDYARWLNVRRAETGHLWQNRFYSCPLDERHQWDALRYVELNPVRACLVPEPAAWRWSSAAAHLSGRDPAGILDMNGWRTQWNAETWRDVLRCGVDDAALLSRIREATRTGRPCGDEDFAARLEASLRRPLRPRKRGPKTAGPAATGQLQFEVM